EEDRGEPVRCRIPVNVYCDYLHLIRIHFSRSAPLPIVAFKSKPYLNQVAQNKSINVQVVKTHFDSTGSLSTKSVLVWPHSSNEPHYSEDGCCRKNTHADSDLACRNIVLHVRIAPENLLNSSMQIAFCGSI